MTEHRNLPEHYAQFKRPFVKVIGVFLSVLALVILFSFLTEKRGLAAFLKDVYFLLVVFVITFCLIYYVIRKRQKKTYDSYQLIVGDDYLTRKQSDMYDMTLSFKEIVAVSEFKGGLIVQGKDKALVISAYIDNYEGVKALLASLRPITAFNYGNLLVKYPLLLSVVMVIGITSTYASNNKLIVSIGGFVALAIMSWLYYKTRSSMYANANSKKSSWLFYLLAFIVILNLLAKLTA